MFRQKYFRSREPKSICKCGHDKYVHVGHDKNCLAECGCLEYVQKKRTKYNATREEIGGTTYDSKLEGRYAQDLMMKKLCGDIKDFKSHVNMPLVVEGKKICDYEVDFVVQHNDGSTEYVEVKGMFLPVGKFKWRLFEALYGNDKNVSLTLVRS